jgi:predicted CXXCH cytochrome family protein
MRNRMLLLGAIAILVAAPALAFHDAGVAHCNGCHTMHNLQDGEAMNFDDTGALGGTAPATGFTDLLLASNATDTCLRCHGRAGASYNVFDTDWATAAGGANLREYYSAGNFGFLAEDDIGDGRSFVSPDQAGHNLFSPLMGTFWDATLDAPPSDGTSPMTNNKLMCTSCHDPHGNDAFRLLYKSGQEVEVGGEIVTYGTTVVAYGISYSQVESQSNHNAYVSGYSAWCATCHTGLHQASGALIHPSGEPLGSNIAINYNKYNGTTDCVTSATSPCGTGVAATAYLPDVPFEDDDFTEADRSSTAGPDSASRVACMSCHRAHATSAANMGRWDFDVTLLDEDGDRSGSWPIPNPYDENQRSLCNKCHQQDEFDHIVAIVP